jgi:hypothetical protein
MQTPQQKAATPTPIRSVDNTAGGPHETPSGKTIFV